MIKNMKTNNKNWKLGNCWRQWFIRIITPRISLTCINNGEKYIEECLRSALSQTLREIEILVIDDASTDRTRELVSAFCREDERVRLLRRAVRGVNFLSGSPASRTAPPAPRAWTGARSARLACCAGRPRRTRSRSVR